MFTFAVGRGKLCWAAFWQRLARFPRPCPLFVGPRPSAYIVRLLSCWMFWKPPAATNLSIIIISYFFFCFPLLLLLGLFVVVYIYSLCCLIAKRLSTISCHAAPPFHAQINLPFVLHCLRVVGRPDHRPVYCPIFCCFCCCFSLRSPIRSGFFLFFWCPAIGEQTPFVHCYSPTRPLSMVESSMLPRHFYMSTPAFIRALCAGPSFRSFFFSCSVPSL